MDPELECRVCYRTYNPDHRCPRDLHCTHTFCERCLHTLSGQEGLRLIVCPLCRVTTPLSGRTVGEELRVNETLMERLSAQGLGDQEEEEEEEDDEVPVKPAEEVESGGRARRIWRKVWRKIRGDGDYFTKEEFRDLTLLTSYWF